MTPRVRRAVKIAALAVVAMCIGVYAFFVHARTYLVGAPLPPVDVTTLSGAARTFKPQPHRVNVVVFFATWCDDCQREMPVLSSLVRRFPDVRFTAIDGGESGASAARFLHAYGFEGAAFVNPGGDSLGIYDIPTVFIVGKNGVVRDRIVGGATERSLESKIARALRG